MQTRIFKSVACMLVLLCASACVKERSFTVDEGLLEERSVNVAAGASYCMPAGFKAVRQGMTDSIAAQELQSNPFGGRISAIYVDTLLRNATAIVTDMSAVPQERTENKLDFYFTEFNPTGFWDEVELQRYKFGDFSKIVQLDMYNSKKHYIKLYFYDENKARFCVDYLFDRDFYNDLMPFIESSIGSFEFHRDFTITTIQ